MTLASVSQHDQVTALTRGTSLPLAPLGADVLEIILEAVAHAWAHVKATHPGHLETGNEAAISALLVSRLNETLGTDPLLGMLVACVDRGSENISFDGKKLEMRPDLQFALTALDKRFRLIGEAKIIDIPKKKTPSLYRTKGIARFVRGDYAWTSREAFMVGVCPMQRPTRCRSPLRAYRLCLIELRRQGTGVTRQSPYRDWCTREVDSPSQVQLRAHSHRVSWCDRALAPLVECEPCD
ncbi:MAG: hypothetical protein HC793_00035 [Aquincola sp.]|nr:hypothetical protein [Aquincola sp.]